MTKEDIFQLLETMHEKHKEVHGVTADNSTVAEWLEEYLKTSMMTYALDSAIDDKARIDMNEENVVRELWRTIVLDSFKNSTPSNYDMVIRFANKVVEDYKLNFRIGDFQDIIDKRERIRKAEEERLRLEQERQLEEMRRLVAHPYNAASIVNPNTLESELIHPNNDNDEDYGEDEEDDDSKYDDGFFGQRGYRRRGYRN